MGVPSGWTSWRKSRYTCFISLKVLHTMQNIPSPRHPIACASDAEIAYVADNSADAAALERQMGGLVEIRQRIVGEVTYCTSPSRTPETSRRRRRSDVFSIKCAGL